jgi:glycerol-3-phosphate dehydrogenase
MLVFCVPHQFVESICKQLKGKVTPSAKAISLIKGMEVFGQFLFFVVFLVDLWKCSDGILEYLRICLIERHAQGGR